MSRRFFVPVALFAALGASSVAEAAEVRFDGFYQARTRLFDTLSLSRDLTNAEGMSWMIQHRFWMRPKFLISEQVGMFAEIRGLDNQFWGANPNGFFDPVTGEATPALFVDEYLPSAPGADGLGSIGDISLWRAWGEIHTDIGTFKFGRMPLHWGLGIWQNDGLGINQEFGDSTDRIMWEHVVNDVYLRAAVDSNLEGLVNARDDMTSYNVAVAYRTERVETGINAQFRRLSDFNLFTVSGAVDAEAGRFDLAAEIVGRFGRGDFPDGLNDAQVLQMGAALDAKLNLDKGTVELQAGLATGDGDDTDTKLGEFGFDRDFNVGLFMFEQPMPVLADPNAVDNADARDFDATQTGNGVANALYVRPRGTYKLADGLFFEGQFIAGRVLKMTNAMRAADRRIYGFELDAGLRYDGIEHVQLVGNLGVFVPGNFYRNLDVDGLTGFDATAFGLQAIARISF